MKIPYPARIGAEWLENEDGTFYTIDGFVYGHWNGWTVAGFTRENVQRIVDIQAKFPRDAGHFEWDGDALNYTGTVDCDYEDAARIEPNEHGHYIVGDGWCWDEETDEPTEHWTVLFPARDGSGKHERLCGWFASYEEAKSHAGENGRCIRNE